ncbi:MAG: hypothetical protein JHC33_10250 [Ignisphaera sp.]|nr:hypothetical protein [Ignisphaera sp.]
MVDKRTEFPKLTASNSIAVGGMIFYYKKDSIIYGVWEYKTGLKIASFISKDKANQWINKNIERIKVKLNDEKKK